jgi:hypothetical protein
MRMAPSHAAPKFWWELILVCVLVFLLVGARSQRNQERATDLAAAARIAVAPSAEIIAVVPILGPPLALK